MLEKHLEEKLGKWVKTQLCAMYYKFTSPARRNVPDRIVVASCPKCPHCGNASKVMFIELKRKGNKPTTGQLKELLELQERGAIAFWVDDLEEAKQRITNEIHA